MRTRAGEDGAKTARTSKERGGARAGEGGQGRARTGSDRRGWGRTSEDGRGWAPGPIKVSFWSILLYQEVVERVKVQLADGAAVAEPDVEVLLGQRLRHRRRLEILEQRR